MSGPERSGGLFTMGAMPRRSASGLAIEATDLVKTYRGGVRALDGLSLDVHAGEIFGLLGRNGAGKSTAVKVLTTLSRPDSGAAAVAGLDVVRDAAQVRRLIGVVSQQHSGDVNATGRENLSLQGGMYGLGRSQLRARVGELLETFGLTGVADRTVRGYSGGTQRRLDIAMAMVHAPRVLFLDEPTTGLDPEVRAALWQEITRLAAVDGLTILLTTHYLEEADRLADRLVVVDRGRRVVTGTPSALKAQLRSDFIHVELTVDDEGGIVSRVLAAVPGVRDVSVRGTSVRARADSGARTTPDVLLAIDRCGFAVASVTVARPSLDDVYLHFTGRELTGPPEPQGSV
jgi:ABC-2 type transport system ATP-binding protein